MVGKANPLPLLPALEEVARGLGRPLHLWMAGWASRPEEEAPHREALAACPSVAAQLVDGRDAEARRGIWAADPLHAALRLDPGNLRPRAGGGDGGGPPRGDARLGRLSRHGAPRGGGLPRADPHGAPGHGALARRFAEGTDGHLQHLHLVQSHVQIDVGAYARALGALARDEGLRRRMGAAGQAHVAARLDWRAVIPRCLDLAGELAELRRGAAPTTPALSPGLPNPLETDPFELYAGYPSAVIGAGTPVHPGPRAAPEEVERAHRVGGGDVTRRRPVSAALAARVLAEVARRPGLTVAELARALGLDAPACATAVLHLAKAHALRLPEPPLRGDLPPS